MSASVQVEPVAFHADARGWVIEPLGADQLHVQRNAHVAFTAPGAIRGNHFHHHRKEVFVVVGPGLVRWREGGQVHDVAVPAGQAMRFTVPPGIPHAIKNTGTNPMVLMAFSTQPHDRESRYRPGGADRELSR
jgi:dTDP-4-dehydrorhamnose 3,5-epimerase-like enzyme